MNDAKTETTKQSKPKEKKQTLVLIRSRLTAGKLFSSLGVIGPGEEMELPKDEAKHYCDCGKAEIPFPE